MHHKTGITRILRGVVISAQTLRVEFDKLSSGALDLACCQGGKFNGEELEFNGGLRRWCPRGDGDDTVGGRRDILGNWGCAVAGQSDSVGVRH
jgi:hypothetical protein